MPRTRSLREIDTLVELAREYCSALAAFRCAKLEGRLGREDEERTEAMLKRMDQRIALLKSNSELDRRRALLKTNVIPLAHSHRKAAQ